MIRHNTIPCHIAGIERLSTLGQGSQHSHSEGSAQGFPSRPYEQILRYISHRIWQEYQGRGSSPAGL